MSAPSPAPTTGETRFLAAFAFTRTMEGGYYDGSEARDPNPTNFGVIQDTYDRWRRAKRLPVRPVKEIAEAEVVAIYRGYWDGASCGLLGPATAGTVFDMSINAGSSAAVKCLQRALRVDADGEVGPKTRAAIAAADDQELATRVCLERIAFYVDLARRKATQRANLLSWADRVARYWLTALR